MCREVFSMISPRIEDFDEIISMIKKCMQENQWLLYLPRDELGNKIAESFNLEVNDANELDLIKFLGKQIEDIANETDPINKKISVDGTRWMVYYHHLYLLFG